LIQRALLLDPDSHGLRYNLACALLVDVGDAEAALEVITPFFERVESPGHIKHFEADPDFDSIRDDPRFKQLLASAKERLGMAAAAE
jgi:adenylate cyclase